MPISTRNTSTKSNEDDYMSEDGLDTDLSGLTHPLLLTRLKSLLVMLVLLRELKTRETCVIIHSILKFTSLLSPTRLEDIVNNTSLVMWRT